MAKPTHNEKAHLVNLIGRINNAIRELECYLAEQRELTRRDETNSVDLASSVSRRQDTDKSALM